MRADRREAGRDEQYTRAAFADFIPGPGLMHLRHPHEDFLALPSKINLFFPLNIYNLLSTPL